MEKEKKLNISAIQMCSKVGDKKANFEKVSDLILRDITSETDVIVLPEVWTVGWSPKHFRESAEKINSSETVNFLSETAKKYNSWVIGGSFIEKDDAGNYYNTCPVINRSGELICKYSKNHLFSYYGCDEGKFITTGNNPVMVDIEGIKTGLTICYDIRFPEIYRAYRKAGADLFINCAAWGLNKPVPWECMTRCRAVENQTFMVALTQSGYIENGEWNIGHSRLIDFKGESLTEIKDQKEGAMTASLYFNEMYEFRDKCTCIKDIKETYEVEII
ncbi:MAG: nitrilase-related carbon-nitrogen hydrolase [Candidatus Gastranaerophilaceae bacterium]